MMEKIVMKTEPKGICLYTGAAPGSAHWRDQEQENFNQLWRTQVVFNVTDPTLIVFAADLAHTNGLLTK